jgi:malate dehydrogenase (oxaloacetate-decarboxylating)
MLTAAAVAVGERANIQADRGGALLPDRSQLVQTATAVARAVARAAVADGVAPPLDPDQIDAAIDATRWCPRYQSALDSHHRQQGDR